MTTPTSDEALVLEILYWFFGKPREKWDDLDKKQAEEMSIHIRTALTRARAYQDRISREGERENIIAWCERRCEANTRRQGTTKWNGDLEDLISHLTNLNEKR